MKKNTDLSQFFPQFNQNTPGCAVGIISNDKLISTWCVGLSNVENKIPISSLTAFRLASLTKPFTAMAIMILKDRKKLTFEDPISQFIPDFPSYGELITVRNLLTHTSGMPDHEKPLYNSMRKGEEPDIYNAYKILKHEPNALFIPNSRSQYSDAGYVILALIIESISGQSYKNFITDNIFLPLGMNNSIVVDSPKVYIKNRACGYRKINGTYELNDYDPLNYIVGDEGIYSTIEDLAIWSKSWYSKLLVKEKTLQEAFIPQILADGTPGRCGFSWFLDKKNLIFQDGFWVGFTNIMLRDVRKKRTVILLSNTNEFSDEKKRVKTALRVINNVI